MAPVHELKGVGENLRDHYSPRVKFAITARTATFNDEARGWRLRRGAEVRAVGRGLPADHVGADPYVLPHAAGAGELRTPPSRSCRFSSGSATSAASRGGAASPCMSTSCARRAPARCTSSQPTPRSRPPSASTSSPPAPTARACWPPSARGASDGHLAAQGADGRGDRARREYHDR